MTIFGHDVIEIIINWSPMLLLVGVWIYYLKRMRVGLDLTRRQVESLERIASAIEKKG